MVKYVKENVDTDYLFDGVSQITNYIDDYYIKFGAWFRVSKPYNGFKKSILDTEIFVGYSTDYLVIRYGKSKPVTKKFKVERGMMDFVIDDVKRYLIDEVF